MMKPVGKPDAGKLHVRFDERGGETERASTRHRAPPRLYWLFLVCGFFLLIAHGDEGSREDLGIVETNLTAAEKAEAERLARDWRPQAAALP